MERVTTWVRGLLVLVFLVSFLETLAPEGDLRKYVRLAVSFLVLLAVAGPFFGFFGRGGETLESAVSRSARWIAPARSPSQGDEAAGRRLAEANQLLAVRVFRRDFERYLTAELQPGIGGQVSVRAELDVSGHPQRLWLTTPGAGEDRQALRRHAAALAGLPEAQVIVETGGPGRVASPAASGGVP